MLRVALVAFDTLEYSEKLQAVGFSAEQAKVQTETLKQLLDNNIATKQNLREMELRLKYDIIKWVAGMFFGSSRTNCYNYESFLNLRELQLEN